MRTTILATALPIAGVRAPSKTNRAIDVGKPRRADRRSRQPGEVEGILRPALRLAIRACSRNEQGVEIVSRGQSIGTIRGPTNHSFNGVVYVQVADIQASCNKATGWAPGRAGIPVQPVRAPGRICPSPIPQAIPWGCIQDMMSGEGPAMGFSLHLSDVADEKVRLAIVAPLVRFNESQAGPRKPSPRR
jgi:hypothetical protein